jgi:hypothetical protein
MGYRHSFSSRAMYGLRINTHLNRKVGYLIGSSTYHIGRAAYFNNLTCKFFTGKSVDLNIALVPIADMRLISFSFTSTFTSILLRSDMVMISVPANCWVPKTRSPF